MFKGKSVQKIKWKQTDGQTDRRTDTNHCFTFRAYAVGRWRQALLISVGAERR